jgi:hypothetical protein
MPSAQSRPWWPVCVWTRAGLPHRLRARHTPKDSQRSADLGYQPGFTVVSNRWMVERACSWLGCLYRLSND